MEDDIPSASRCGEPVEPSGHRYRELKSLIRQRLRLIWEMAQMGKIFDGEDAVLIKALREHPEYYEIWDRVDEPSDEELIQDGVNPILHVTIHQTIENQLAAKDPPVVHETLERLMRSGLSRHEAIHAIGSVLSVEIWEILSQERPFDEERYERGLQQLNAREWAPARSRQRRVKKEKRKRRRKR
jgi:hypothetical protein